MNEKYNLNLELNKKFKKLYKKLQVIRKIDFTKTYRIKNHPKSIRIFKDWFLVKKQNKAYFGSFPWK